jgi:hypothetical protein
MNEWDQTGSKFCNSLIRIVVYGIISGICAIPALTIKVDMVGSPLIIMLVCIIIPGILQAYLTVGGPFDYIVGRN